MRKGSLGKRSLEFLVIIYNHLFCLQIKIILATRLVVMIFWFKEVYSVACYNNKINRPKGC